MHAIFQKEATVIIESKWRGGVKLS